MPLAVQPLQVITLARTELPIKKILLPNRFFFSARPMTRRSSPPELHPALKRCLRKHRRCAKEVNVIRHDHITANMPVICGLPRSKKRFHGISAVKQWSPLIHVGGDVNDDA